MNFEIEYDLWWAAGLRLPSWAGFQSRLGRYGSIDKPEPSDGTARLVFAPEGRGLEPLSAQEQNLIAWFEHNEPSVSEAVKQAIISWCSPECAARTGEFDFGDDFPVVESASDLKRCIGLYSVNIHKTDHGGVPYMGYEFGCTWDEEHGLGVLMHGTRCVEIGQADVAFTLWRVVRDVEGTG
jgi:hypothetical protein